MRNQRLMGLGDCDWGGLFRMELRRELLGVFHIIRREELAGNVALSGDSLLYVATPYSREVVDDDGDWCARKNGEILLRDAAIVAELAGWDISAFSPIVNSAAMLSALSSDVGPLGRPLIWDLPEVALDADSWEELNAPFLQACPFVFVPNIEGRQKSIGIWREVITALCSGKVVYYETEAV